jgi:hypothetical protein
VTLLELYPALLLLGVLSLAMMWAFRHIVRASFAARRLASAAIGFLSVLLVVALAVRLMAPADVIRPSRLLNWKLNPGLYGRPDPAAARSATVVTIEVEHPGCTSMDFRDWVADPIITYTPWSVTITMHMTDATNCSSQQTPHEGGLPLVGGYLTGVFYPVHLSEPLGGRMLFDGSSFPPAARSPL